LEAKLNSNIEKTKKLKEVIRKKELSIDQLKIQNEQLRAKLNEL
jgi:hypothetical protein